jgi:putative phosphoesterase
MRLGVVSDIHGNVPALEAALAAFDGEVDEVWCAGDIVLEYRFSNEMVALLRETGVTAILGNHDMVFLSPAGVTARTAPAVDQYEVAWLASLPHRHEIEADGHRLLMVHGSPWEPYGDYVRAGNPKWREADDLDADIVIVGHTHEPMVERFGSTLVVNPGSLGEPRSRDDRRGSYAVIDTATGDAVIGHVEV